MLSIHECPGFLFGREGLDHELQKTCPRHCATAVWQQLLSVAFVYTLFDSCFVCKTISFCWSLNKCQYAPDFFCLLLAIFVTSQEKPRLSLLLVVDSDSLMCVNFTSCLSQWRIVKCNTLVHKITSWLKKTSVFLLFPRKNCNKI